jgi:hypothetical protein
MSLKRPWHQNELGSAMSRFFKTVTYRAPSFSMQPCSIVLIVGPALGFRERVFAEFWSPPGIISQKARQTPPQSPRTSLSRDPSLCRINPILKNPIPGAPLQNLVRHGTQNSIWMHAHKPSLVASLHSVPISRPTGALTLWPSRNYVPIDGAIHEQDAGDDLRDQIEALEPAPIFLGLQAEFKDHGQGCDS